MRAPNLRAGRSLLLVPLGVARARASAGVVLFVAVLAMLSSMSGCSVLRRDSDTNDPTSPPTGEFMQEAPLDSLPGPVPLGQADVPSQEDIGPELGAGHSTVTDSTIALPDSSDVLENAPEAVEPTPAPTPPVPDPEPPIPEEGTFRVELPEDERAALIEQASKDLATAADVVRAWDGRDGISEETLERLRTIEDFMDEAHAALDGGDVQGAANLALKARLLAVEIGPP